MSKKGDRRIQDTLPVGVNRRVEDRSVQESDVVHNLVDLQVGSEFLLNIGQDYVDFMQALRIVVANLEEGFAVHDGVAPEDLVHRQPAHDVLIQDFLVVAADGDFHVPDVIDQVGTGDWRGELAV